MQKLSMHSTQTPADPRDILTHDCSLDFVAKTSDISFMPSYWQETGSVFDRLLFRLDEEHQLKAQVAEEGKRKRSVTSGSEVNNGKKTTGIKDLEDRDADRAEKREPASVDAVAREADDGKPKDDNARPGPTSANNSVIFVREGGSVKVPELKVFGDKTMNDLLKWAPDLQNNMNDKTPVIVHRFVTVNLEVMMKQ